MENRKRNFTECARPNLMVVDDDPLTRDDLQRLYTENAYSVVGLSSAEEGLKQVSDNVDFVITEIKLPGIDGVQFISQLHQNYPEIPVIVITGFAEIQAAVDALKLGACDFVMKPFDSNAVLQSTRAALENTKAHREIRHLRRWLKDHYQFNELLSETPQMRQVLEAIRMAASTDAGVLIHGEIGTGKESVANAIHYHSERRAGPFVAVNCASFPEMLLERELLGFDKDATLGAHGAKPGKIATAHGGTLFLDEIENLSAVMQEKLLRALKDRQLQRLGSSHNLHVDVRVIAGINGVLKRALSNGLLRSDLYSRLNVVPIHLAPLRERAVDIPLIVQNFLCQHPVAKSKRIVSVSDKVLRRLMDYSWPGNFRELQNALERAILLAPGRIIDDVALAEADKKSDDEKRQIVSSASLRLWLREKEKSFLAQKLEALGGNVGLTAKSCRIGVRTLSRKMRLYGLDKKRYKERSQADKPSTPRNN